MSKSTGGSQSCEKLNLRSGSFTNAELYWKLFTENLLFQKIFLLEQLWEGVQKIHMVNLLDKFPKSNFPRKSPGEFLPSISKFSRHIPDECYNCFKCYDLHFNIFIFTQS